MNDRIMIGEHQFHIPSLCAGGFRLAAAAVGTGKPYGNELMQAWFLSPTTRYGIEALLRAEDSLDPECETERHDEEPPIVE